MASSYTESLDECGMYAYHSLQFKAAASASKSFCVQQTVGRLPIFSGAADATRLASARELVKRYAWPLQIIPSSRSGQTHICYLHKPQMFCSQAYWPFHRVSCQRNEFADAVEDAEPKFASWMRSHGKLAVLKDDEVDRLERAGAATMGASRGEVLQSMYNRLEPKPQGASMTPCCNELSQRQGCHCHQISTRCSKIVL